MSLLRSTRRLALFSRYQTRMPFCTQQSQQSPPTHNDTTSKENEGKTHENDRDELAELYDAILMQVPQYGWTDDAINQAVKELGWSVAAKGMISRGPVQVVEEFVRRSNRELAIILAERNEKQGVATAADIDRAVEGIRERISMIEPYHASWGRALGLQALPQNSARAFKQSALMIDEIAHYSGFSNPDVSWYSDRAVLALAYHSTELYWLTDKSNGRQDTWRFLQRRLKDSDSLRNRVGSAYLGLMNFHDATTSSISTLIKSVRRSY